MLYRLKLFAVLKERVGADTWECHSDTNITGSQLLSAFFAAYPALEKLRGVTRLAVNRVFCTEDVLLQENDELALIPPVSGG